MYKMPLLLIVYILGLGEGLYRDGVTHIINIDSCSSVIDVMNTKHKLLSEMKCRQTSNLTGNIVYLLLDLVDLTMDVRNLKFDDRSFDAVLDKGSSNHD